MFVVILAMTVVVFMVRRYRQKNNRPQNVTPFTSTSSHRPLLSPTSRPNEKNGPMNRELMPLKRVQIAENPQYHKQCRPKCNSCKLSTHCLLEFSSISFVLLLKICNKHQIYRNPTAFKLEDNKYVHVEYRDLGIIEYNRFSNFISRV